MALTTDTVTQINTLQGIVANFVNLLNQQTYIDPTIRATSGLSDANITAINTTITDILGTINTLSTA